jgi:CRISPR-associated endonuclease/helicase Cas3
MLSVEDFAAFFEEVHGCPPFPWQERLLAQVAAKGQWPSVLDLPTGSGKTAAIDIAVFLLALELRALEAGSLVMRSAPVRIAFVVDRRLVVDDAFGRAEKLAEALWRAEKPVTTRVAACLKALSGGGPPLIARRLRGGIPREDDWARTPSQPTVLCSTVDQVGSRLLFRGYGVSDSMKPVHAGLIGSDCLILLDEAHLAEPFRQTLCWIALYRGPKWREAKIAAPWGVALLTATPGEKPQDVFSLDDKDRSHPVLKKRLDASKPARLTASTKPKAKPEGSNEAADEDDDRHGSDKDLARRVTTIVDEVRRSIDHFKKAANGAPVPAIGVVVNRVARARGVFERLSKEFQEQIAAGTIDEPVLMIGPARPVDRDELVRSLEPIRTRTWKEGERRALDKSLIVVATQCIEAGVDIDLDALVTEAAPLDCLRQRFGRLNRAGRDIIPYAAIVAGMPDVSARADDPVYGKAIKATWDRLMEAAKKDGSESVVEFGFNGFSVSMTADDVLAPKEDAPILLPAHLDLLSQTSPIPAADPDVALYLHGASRQPDSITVVWRADIDAAWIDQDLIRLLTLVPPRSREAIELPLWTVRRWLEGSRKLAADMADIPAREPEPDEKRQKGSRIFRWKGNDERSRWIDPAALRPGDTVIVPASYGGVDRFGWNPNRKEPATDVARKAAESFAGRRFGVRVAPGLLKGPLRDALANTLASAVSERWRDVRAALMELDLPEDIQEDLLALDHAHRKRGTTAHLDLYGLDDGRPRGVVFVAPFGIIGRKQKEDGRPNATEDDASGSIFGSPLSLRQHGCDVERKAEDFAKAAGLPAERIADLSLAGFLHDEGKRDPRFQAWLHYGDPLGSNPDDEEDILAKSSRPLPPAARVRSGLPENWRHEALSVRLARAHERVAVARDPDLVLWLIGSHHGYGRPFFPHQDPLEQPPDIGPQSLAFDWNGYDWSSLFARLKVRYGVWELARMEAILRLADHRASEDARDRAAKENCE